jgi:DNA-binding transcriptional LysR family regulator
MNVYQLRTFCVLANKGSFSRTAQELHLTQPAVSMHIKALENFYGVGLFDRVDKKLVLTEAGKTLYNYAGQIFNLINETQRAISDFSELKRGSIILGASNNIGVYVLPSVLGEFKNKYPKIHIQVSIDTTRVIEQRILGNEIDIGIVEAQVRGSDLVLEHWGAEKLILITSPKHQWAQLKSIEPNVMIDEPFIVGGRGSGTRRVLEKNLPDIVNKLKVYLELGSTEAVKKAVEENLGVSICGENTVSREIKNGQLKAININGIELYKNFTIIYLKGKVITSAMKKFLESLHDKSIIRRLSIIQG